MILCSRLLLLNLLWPVKIHNLDKSISCLDKYPAVDAKVLHFLQFIYYFFSYCCCYSFVVIYIIYSIIYCANIIINAPRGGVIIIYCMLSSYVIVLYLMFCIKLNMYKHILLLQ